MSEEDCLFCKVVSGGERSWVVYRDERLMAILNTHPLTRGHTLVVPVQHFEGMFDIPEGLLRRIMSLAKRLCRSYERTLSIQGVSIELMNHRQKTPALRHFHLHVIPRYNKNDERDPSNVKPSQRFPRESDRNLNRTLSLIRSDRTLGTVRTRT